MGVIHLCFNRTIHPRFQVLFFLSFIILLIPNCSPPDYADVILFNGKIIKVDRNFTIQQALAVKDGKILAVDSNDIISRLAGAATRKIDLGGKTVIPGINEGHTHSLTASVSEYLSPIPDVYSIKELLSWIHSEATQKDPGEWIIHPKFFATRMLEMRQPTKYELDSVAPNHPVFLNGSFGGMVNSKAFQISGITNDTVQPGILKDKQGRATGIIRSSAFDLLSLPENSNLGEAQQLKLLKEMLQLYNSVGITSICSGSGTSEDIKWYRKLQQTGELTVRVFQNLYVPFDPHATLDEIRTSLIEFDHKTGQGDEWVKVGALKVLVDGGVLTGTAYLREPWGEGAIEIYGITDLNYRGILNLSKEELIRIITATNEFGWKFTAHVTGGGGVDVLLAALGEVDKVSPINNKRFSIIHGNFFTPEAITKMAAMGIYADMQPAWFFKDADLLNQVLGEKRMNTFHPYKSLMEAGIMVNGGSDHMVKLDSYTSINPYNPFIAMWSVVTRKTERGSVYAPYEAISREQALKMYTINNAYASFEEDIKGSLEPGKLADLVVLSEDILTCPEEHIKDIKALLTMVDGKVVYEANK